MVWYSVLELWFGWANWDARVHFSSIFEIWMWIELNCMSASYVQVVFPKQENQNVYCTETSGVLWFVRFWQGGGVNFELETRKTPESLSHGPIICLIEMWHPHWSPSSCVRSTQEPPSIPARLFSSWSAERANSLQNLVVCSVHIFYIHLVYSTQCASFPNLI